MSTFEPVVSSTPIAMQFVKEKVVDPRNASKVISFRDFKRQHEKRRPGVKIDKSMLNTTTVPTTGRTSERKLAKRLNLREGEVFRWDGGVWRDIVRRGDFQVVKMEYGVEEVGEKPSVTMQIEVSEAPPRSLEYGVTSSLHSGSWEGSMSFDHRNLFGGNEKASVEMKRGTQDPVASFRVRYEDGKFGRKYGFDADGYNEYIGECE